MPLFLWKPSYELGVPEIDADHRQLVGMINGLYDEIKGGRGVPARDRAIDDLLGYVQRHFATEESFMRLCNYPQMAAHEEAHRSFQANLQAMARRRDAGSAPSAAELLTVMCDWMSHHVTTVDKELVAWLRRFQR